MVEQALRVCYFGTYRRTYSRNRILITGLQRNGVTVIECHEPLWQGIDDRVNTVTGGWLHPSFWRRIMVAYSRLLRRYWSIRHDYDILITGYPGQLDVFLARLLSWWQGKPLVWDVFMSIYLIALERELAHRNRLAVALLRRLEWLACRLPDRLILDTEEYVMWFHRTHGVAHERFRPVPTGADSDLFCRSLVTTKSPSTATSQSTVNGCFRVIYYGTFIPNHGVKTIVEAARLLADDDTIHFTLIGDGPDRNEAQTLANQYGLTNLTFVEWLEQDALIQRVVEADVVLGAFGTTPQSLMTVQNKIYEGLALGKAVVSGDGPAVRRTLEDGVEIYLCERNNGEALATAIQNLATDSALHTQMAAQGYARFIHEYAIEPLGQRIKTHLLEVMANR